MSWSIMTPSSYIVLHFANPVSSLLNLAAMSVTSWSSVGQAAAPCQQLHRKVCRCSVAECKVI